MFGKFSTGEEELRFLSRLTQVSGRRTFLKWSGITMAVATVGCSAEDSLQSPNGSGPGAVTGQNGAVDLGTGDFLILNFAFALEQLEAAFYSKVIASPYSGISAEESQILDDVRKHELVHRDFFNEALGANGIPDLEVDFSSVDFSSRDSVLTTARTFEDLGVSAYNGAAKFIVNPDYLLAAGKIVSVEARHAAAIRDLLAPKTAAFAGDDVVNAMGLDVVRTPAEVFSLADPFIVTEIDASKLPTT